MNFLQYLWHAFRIARNSRKRWKNRTCYTWRREPDYRDFTGQFRRENGR